EPSHRSLILLCTWRRYQANGKSLAFSVTAPTPCGEPVGRPRGGGGAWLGTDADGGGGDARQLLFAGAGKRRGPRRQAAIRQRGAFARGRRAIGQFAGARGGFLGRPRGLALRQRRRGRRLRRRGIDRAR